MIKFIYFDVGGVLLKDFSCTNKWEELRRSIGIDAGHDDAFSEFFAIYEKEICLGTDIQSLVPLMEKEFGLNFPDRYSFLDEFVDRFEKNDSIVPVFASIPKDIRIGQLTNMYPGMLDAINKKGLIPETKWTVVIDSSIEKVRKPQKEIFELAQKRAGVGPRQILFIENSKEHVLAAKEAGWNTFLYDSSDYVKASKDLIMEINKLTS
ncbi:MAG: HAD-IA family hydrolase [Candidatus Roizmanbacteria bacterium]